MSSPVLAKSPHIFARYRPEQFGDIGFAQPQLAVERCIDPLRFIHSGRGNNETQI
jgi:hypothetical protein